MNTIRYGHQAKYDLLRTFPKPITEGAHRVYRDEFRNYKQLYLNDEFVREWVERNYNYHRVKSIIDRE